MRLMGTLMLKTPVVVIQLILYNKEELVSSLLYRFLEFNIREVSCECVLLAVLNIHLLLHKCSLQIPLMAQKMSNDTVLILMALI